MDGSFNIEGKGDINSLLPKDARHTNNSTRIIRSGT